MTYDEDNDQVKITLKRDGAASCKSGSMFTITDNAYDMEGSPWSYDKSQTITF